jgi:multidrug efflux pump subunit AcrA (membrane-fusion protein)
VGLAEVEQAQKLLGAAEANVDSAGAEVKEAEASLRAAQADERRMAALLGYAKLRAPFMGVVT